MPIIEPDLSEAEQLGPHDPGTYKATIESVEVTKGKEKGTPMIVPNFAVMGSDGKIFHRKSFIVTTGAGAGNFEQLLRACNLGDVADQLKSSKAPFNTDVLVGQQVNVILGNQEYKGQMRDSIDGFLRV